MLVMVWCICCLSVWVKMLILMFCVLGIGFFRCVFCWVDCVVGRLGGR